MSDKPAITDEPLPDAELVASESASADDPGEAPGFVKTDTMPGGAAHADFHDHLPDPHFSPAGSGYGHNDPASMAGNIQIDLHAPHLEVAKKEGINQPIWGQSQPADAQAEKIQEMQSAPVTQDETTTPKPGMVAHLTQVGLVSADQWEEQIQPRLAQLHEDIAQVHTQLDVLERQKPKK
jgi:hypothetical protein